MDIVKFYAVKHECKPHVGSAGAAAYDLRINLGNHVINDSYITLPPGASRVIGSGLHVEIPEGWCGIIVPRSGLGTRGLHIQNVVGLIDHDYRGEIKLGLVNNGCEELILDNYSRVAQLVIIPHWPTLAAEYVDNLEELTDTERGSGGFGHSGVL